MDWRNGVLFSEGEGILSLRPCIQTGSAAHPTSNGVGYGVFFPWSKAPGS